MQFWECALAVLRRKHELSWLEHRAIQISALEFLRCDGIPDELAGDVLRQFNDVVRDFLPDDDLGLQTFVDMTRQVLVERCADAIVPADDEQPYVDPDAMREQQRPFVSP